jgi:shikimate kinase
VSNRGRAPGRPIFLVGFMGAGKSAAGKALAAELGWAFADTDALVEEAAGASIEEIFRAAGEGRFRDLEWRALQSLGGRRDLVVATGGGLFLGVVQRAFLKAHGASVWLDASLARIRGRIGAGQGRPLWTGHDPVALRAFFEKRRAAYALADHRVDPEGLDPREVAERILWCFSAQDR